MTISLWFSIGIIMGILRMHCPIISPPGKEIQDKAFKEKFMSDSSLFMFYTMVAGALGPILIIGLIKKWVDFLFLRD